MISLERRFVAGLVAVLLLVFALLFWLSVTAVQSLSEAYVASRLEHDAEALAGALWVNPHGERALRQGRITPVYHQPLSGHYFLLRFADGKELRSRSLWDEQLHSPDLAVGEVRLYQAHGPGKQHLQLRSAGYQKLGLSFTLTVAEDLAPMAQQIHRYQRLVLLLLFAALVLIVLVQRYVLRRGFRVLQELRGELERVTAGEQQQLLSLGPLEVQPLTSEVNRLLHQLQQRLQRSRMALGNLAHALKGPLSLMTGDLEQLDLAPAAKIQLAGRLERIKALIQRELKRARFAGEGVGQRFVPQRDVADLVAVVQQIHRERALQIESAPLPPQSLPLEHEDMLELLGNLLDNACKWAKGRVGLKLAVEGDLLTIVVADDGPGIDPGERERLLRRGGRLDEQEDGHGLGLAIVKDLVQEYGGELALDRSATHGGLQVQVRLPLKRS